MPAGLVVKHPTPLPKFTEASSPLDIITSWRNFQNGMHYFSDGAFVLVSKVKETSGSTAIEQVDLTVVLPGVGCTYVHAVDAVNSGIQAKADSFVVSQIGGKWALMTSDRGDKQFDYVPTKVVDLFNLPAAPDLSAYATKAFVDGGFADIESRVKAAMDGLVPLQEGQEILTRGMDKKADLYGPSQNIVSNTIQAQGFLFGPNTAIKIHDTGEGYGPRLSLIEGNDVDFVVLKSDMGPLESLIPGEWVKVTLKPEFEAEGGKHPYVRLLAGGVVQVIGEIKRADGANFAVDQYTTVTAPALPTDFIPESQEARSWVAPTWGGAPTGAHANIIVTPQGALQVNPKVTSPMKVELSGTYYKGKWPT